MKINRENISQHLIEYELNLIGKSFQDIILKESWYSEYTMSQEQFDQLKKYAIPLIKKTFKCNTSKANSTFDWWNLKFGLKIN